MQASLMRPPSNIFPQTRNSGEKKRRDRNQLSLLVSNSEDGVCCIRTKETSLLEKKREREQENLLLPVAWYSNQSIRSFAGVAKRQPESQLFQREWPTVSLRTPSVYAMQGLRSKEFLIDEKMGEDLLPVRLRVGMIIELGYLVSFCVILRVLIIRRNSHCSIQKGIEQKFIELEVGTTRLMKIGDILTRKLINECLLRYF